MNTMLFRIFLAVAIIGFTATILVYNSPLGAKTKEAGAVSRIKPEAAILSLGKKSNAQKGATVLMDDELTTGKKARLEVRLKDETVLTLGENAKIKIDRFVYDPAGKSGKFVAAVKGAFRFTTGKLAKAASKEIEIRTPVATIGVRGTDFWGGPIDNTYGVLLLNGQVEITTSGGKVTLDRPGQGVTISSPTSPPSAPNIWAKERVDRAVASISF